MTFIKQGDKVKTATTPKGEHGIVELVVVPGMPDCALVRFRHQMDGLCLPRRLLTIVEKAGESK